MESKEVLELITAFVDNEIESKAKEKEIKLIIEKNHELNFEYQIQSFVKSTIKSRVEPVETPEYLKNRVINSLVSDIQKRNMKPSRKVPLVRLLFKPAFALFVVLSVIVLVFLLSPNNNPERIVIQQSGQSNMFSQAVQNFQRIVSGNLSAQLRSNNIEELKTYFKDQGINYEAVVPLAKDWQLSGAVVSEIQGKKLAHNIYKNSSGKLAYLFQANEDLLSKQKILNLSDDLINLVNNGKFFRYNDHEKSVIVWKCKNNICILVSNDNLNKLEQFASTK